MNTVTYTKPKDFYYVDELVMGDFCVVNGRIAQRIYNRDVPDVPKLAFLDNGDTMTGNVHVTEKLPQGTTFTVIVGTTAELETKPWNRLYDTANNYPLRYRDAKTS